MDIEYMKARKTELGYTYDYIARLSGLPLSTVQKVLGGKVTAPRKETLRKLERVLGSSAPDGTRSASGMAGGVSEAAYVYGATAAQDSRWDRQGTYTYEDFLAIPEDVRVELIDGVIYDMAVPTLAHQAIQTAIFEQFLPCLHKHPGCSFFVSPVSVRLDKDDRTVVEPDIVIICDRSKLEGRYIWGAPDLLIEVLSPSTRRKDMFLKLNKYMRAGVREYWMIDIPAQKILVYRFEGTDDVTQYTFKDKVPVGICDDPCFIDFSKVYEQISYLLQE